MVYNDLEKDSKPTTQLRSKGEAMDTFDWHPGTLLEMSGFYWQTCTLHAGVKLDLFTLIGEDTLTCDMLLQRIEADKEGLSRLLDALAAMQLLSKKGDTYRNTEASLTFLSKSSKQYVGFMIMHHYHLVDSWHRMDEAVVSGQPNRIRTSTSSEEHRKSFLMGMFNIAMAVAPKLAREIDLTGCKRLLDLGGGPGTFAIHFCMENKGLEGMVYDLPTTKPFAQKTIQRFHMEDRVTFTPGNYIEEDFYFDEPFDVAWLSHILHGEGPEDAAKIIGKTVASMASGGKIFIHEFILDDTRTAPLIPALFSINMLLGTNQGQSYSETELRQMLEHYGVQKIERLPFVGPTQAGILCGTVG